MKIIKVESDEVSLILNEHELVVLNNSILNCLEALGPEFPTLVGIEPAEAWEFIDEINQLIASMNAKSKT